MNGKCGHEQCRCTVDGVDFCGDYCEDRAEATEVEVVREQACHCGHPACAAG